MAFYLIAKQKCLARFFKSMEPLFELVSFILAVPRVSHFGCNQLLKYGLMLVASFSHRHAHRAHGNGSWCGASRWIVDAEGTRQSEVASTVKSSTLDIGSDGAPPLLSSPIRNRSFTSDLKLLGICVVRLVPSIPPPRKLCVCLFTMTLGSRAWAEESGHCVRSWPLPNKLRGRSWSWCGRVASVRFSNCETSIQRLQHDRPLSHAGFRENGRAQTVLVLTF